MLQVNNLSKNFGKIKAVNNVSFKISKGETLVVIGKSGSGKSTLLRLLNGLETPDSGAISGGAFGLVFQEFNLFPQYSVMANLTLAPKLKCNPTSQAENLLKKLGLWEKRNSYPSELSGGQKQRVAIARALMLSPDVLCLDEPTSALDPELTGEIIQLIKSLKGAQTMIIVTHNMRVAEEIADKMAIMNDGKLSMMD